MERKEKAIELLNKFGNKNTAKLCVEEIIADLKQSSNIAKSLNGQAEGLINGSLYFWISVKNELDLM